MKSRAQTYLFAFFLRRLNEEVDRVVGVAEEDPYPANRRVVESLSTDRITDSGESSGRTPIISKRLAKRCCCERRIPGT